MSRNWSVSLADETLVVDYNGTEIAQILGDYEHAHEQMAKDARLVAASVDLLTVLQAYVEAAEAESKAHPGRDGSPFAERLLAGRAAIARATGAATGLSK